MGGNLKRSLGLAFDHTIPKAYGFEATTLCLSICTLIIYKTLIFVQQPSTSHPLGAAKWPA